MLTAVDDDHRTDIQEQPGVLPLAGAEIADVEGAHEPVQVDGVFYGTGRSQQPPRRDQSAIWIYAAGETFAADHAFMGEAVNRLEQTK